MQVITVRNLGYTYDGADEPAVDGLAFEVSGGEVFGFLGPSGAGKTTTHTVLTGLLDDYVGEAKVFEKEIREWKSPDYQRIGVSTETPNLYRKLTGRENLELFASLYGGVDRDPLPLLERVGIADSVDQRVGTYSKGMKMRLNFVRSLVHDPDLVFLDEPTMGIDPGNAKSVIDIIRDLRRAGKTVFLTTHDMTVADQLCDRVAFIVNGQLSVIDSPRALKLEHGQPTVRVEYRANGSLESRQFSLSSLAENQAFHDLLRDNKVETIHSDEATLAEVFISVTGATLE